MRDFPLRPINETAYFYLPKQDRDVEVEFSKHLFHHAKEFGSKDDEFISLVVFGPVGSVLQSSIYWTVKRRPKFPGWVVSTKLRNAIAVSDFEFLEA